MPETLTAKDVQSHTDPSVSKQWDNETPVDQQVKDYYSIVDAIKVCMFGTYRSGTGPVSRSMSIARRDGPDFLFLTNIHSAKVDDLKDSKEVNLAFEDSSTHNWISITGTATARTNDPRIKEVHSKAISAWFGDLKDGVHNGSATDPRMALVEVKAKYISYYKMTVGALGFVKEIAGATLTGGVANTGVLRELNESAIAHARGHQ